MNKFDPDKLSTSKLSFLLSIPVILIVWLLPFLIKKGIFIEYYIEMGLIVILFYFMGLIGAVWAKRREAPQFITIRGKAAYYLGLYLAIVSWGFAIYGCYLILAHYIR